LLFSGPGRLEAAEHILDRAFDIGALPLVARTKNFKLDNRGIGSGLIAMELKES
jgi:hypothetical protein